MEYKTVEKQDYNGEPVKVLDETYEPGTPQKTGVGEDMGWRRHFAGKDQMLRYLKNGERYWYSADWYGSEKRK
jgi:hypothetical protein